MNDGRKSPADRPDRHPCCGLGARRGCGAGAREGFAFAAPRELGRLSAAVPAWLAAGVPLSFAGFAFAAALLIGERAKRGGWFARRRWHANG